MTWKSPFEMISVNYQVNTVSPFEMISRPVNYQVNTVVSYHFIGGGTQYTWRNPQIFSKSLNNFCKAMVSHGPIGSYDGCLTLFS